MVKPPTFWDKLWTAYRINIEAYVFKYFVKLWSFENSFVSTSVPVNFEGAGGLLELAAEQFVATSSSETG